jgi:hypothetical protein
MPMPLYGKPCLCLFLHFVVSRYSQNPSNNLGNCVCAISAAVMSLLEFIFLFSNKHCIDIAMCNLGEVSLLILDLEYLFV